LPMDLGTEINRQKGIGQNSEVAEKPYTPFQPGQFISSQHNPILHYHCRPSYKGKYVGKLPSHS